MQWDPALYARFADHRSRPFLDLTAVSAEEWNQAAAASMRAMTTTGVPVPAPLTAVFRGMTVDRVDAGAQMAAPNPAR